MKYCEEYAALLDPFVDGELPPEEMEQVRDHLESCPGCRAYVDDALALRAGFPDVEDTVVPEGFAEDVMERVQESSAKEQKIVELKRRGVRRWIGTAAALAACCALVILVRTGPGKDAPAGGESPMARAENGAPAAYDAESEELAPQAAPEEAAAEETKKTRMAALDKAPDEADAAKEERNLVAAASPTISGDAAPEANAESVLNPGVKDYEEIALCLTAQEAGDLLDEFTPEQEDESERRYRLNAMEYETLLKELGRWEKLIEIPEAGFQVVVTGPFK